MAINLPDLFTALKKGDLDTVKALLADEKDISVLFDGIYRTRKTAINYALESRNEEIISWYIAQIPCQSPEEFSKCSHKIVLVALEADDLSLIKLVINELNKHFLFHGLCREPEGWTSCFNGWLHLANAKPVEEYLYQQLNKLKLIEVAIEKDDVKTLEALLYEDGKNIERLTTLDKQYIVERFAAANTHKEFPSVAKALELKADELEYQSYTALKNNGAVQTIAALVPSNDLLCMHYLIQVKTSLCLPKVLPAATSKVYADAAFERKKYALCAYHAMPTIQKAEVSLASFVL